MNSPSPVQAYFGLKIFRFMGLSFMIGVKGGSGGAVYILHYLPYWLKNKYECFHCPNVSRTTSTKTDDSSSRTETQMSENLSFRGWLKRDFKGTSSMQHGVGK